MKKIILLILILVITDFIIVSKDNLRQPKDENWEYVKYRLFDGETSTFKKIKRPLILLLENATERDSIMVKDVMSEIRAVIPNFKIDFANKVVFRSRADLIAEGLKFKDSEKRDSIAVILNPTYLSFYTTKDESVGLVKTIDVNFKTISSGISIKREDVKRWGEGFLGLTRIQFLEKESLVDDDYKKNLIRYELFRTLCFIQGSVYNNDSKSIFGSKEYRQDNFQLSEADKFLLQKLYADDFLEQFKNYLQATYSWQYIKVFLNKKLAEKQSMFIVFVIGAFVFVLMFNYFQNRKFKYLFLNYFFPVLLIWFYYFCLHFIYKYLTIIDSRIDSDLYYVIFSLIGIPLLALITSFLLWMLEKKCIKKGADFSFKLVLKVFFTFLVLSLPVVVIFFINGANQIIYDYFFPVFFFWAVLALGRGILIYLNHFSDSLIKEKDVELSRLKQLNAQNELKSLHAHINPHFLYNALNSISGLAYENPAKTEEMAMSLSDLFKYSINRKGKQLSSIEDEVVMVENYLKIEKIRFEERLNFTIDVEEDLLKEEIPMYILQPLIENAVKHGISKIDSEGKIGLEIKREGDKTQITVTDNGPEFPEMLLSGHGLQSVYDLLRLSYGDQATMNWENVPEKKIVIEIAVKN